VAENQTLADLLRQKAQSIVDFPTTVVRNLSDPQAFLKSFGYTPSQQLSGFSAGYAGVPEKQPSDIGVLDPNNREYSKGYSSGEDAALASGIIGGTAALTRPIAKPVGRALGEYAWNKTEKMMQQQGLMPSVVPRDEAENFAKKIRDMGFEANVNHSGSKAGLSSYVSVSDPNTGRYIQYPYRFSDHSKGPYQQQFVNSVTDYEKQLPEIQKSILAMREIGVSPTLLLRQQQQKQVDELVNGGMKPRTAWKQVLETKNEPTRKEIIEQQINKIE
jgi:hypothetical protein